MTKYFNEGDPFYMGILTLILTAIIALFIWCLIQEKKSQHDHTEKWSQRVDLVKSIGLFALIAGILFQLMGLYGAFSAIEEIGDVSPALLAGGLKVSMITTIYGMIISLSSYIMWFFLKSRIFSSNTIE